MDDIVELTTEAQNWTRLFELLHLRKGNLALVDNPVLQVIDGEPITVKSLTTTSMASAHINDKLWQKRSGTGNVCMFVNAKRENRIMEYIKKFISPKEAVTITWGEHDIRLTSEADEVYFPKPHVGDGEPVGWVTDLPFQYKKHTNKALTFHKKKADKDASFKTVFFVNADEMVKTFNKAQWLHQNLFPMELLSDKLIVTLGDLEQKDKERQRTEVPVNYVSGTFTDRYNDQLEHVFRNCEGEVKCYYGELLWMHYDWEDYASIDVIITNVPDVEGENEESK